MDTHLLPDSFLTTQLKKLVNWSRRSSLWPLPFATACCGIELMATASSRYDIARFGAEAMRFSPRQARSEEHTSELQSLRHLVCRLLLGKKKRSAALTSTINNESNDHADC